MYKKFLTQSRASGEEWATKVMESVLKVQNVVSRIHSLVNNIQDMHVQQQQQGVGLGAVNTEALALACEEVLLLLPSSSWLVWDSDE